jgi:glycosyltransferase involved in cell wall biosynthesis
MAGILIAPYFVRPLADAVWLPGERQAQFARRLGFDQRRIFRGLYTCDRSALEAQHLTRVAEKRAVKRSFLFVGRFIPEKGVDTLVEAYRVYRKTTADAWPMVCCGSGPLLSRLQGQPGIHVEGFVQPERLPAMFASAGCFVLASKFEPWALVVHEAASAGLLVLSSDQVGAAVHLVQPGYNGYIFGGGDVAGLASLMSEASAMSDTRLDEMSQASYALSQQFSPKHWADTLLRSFYVLPRAPGANGGSAAVPR